MRHELISPENQHGKQAAAQKIQTLLLIDDIDGSEAAGTVRSGGLDGASYEIDLSAGHAAELRGAPTRFSTPGHGLRL